MKHFAYILLVLLLAGCNRSSKKAEATNSTSTSADTTTSAATPPADSSPVYPSSSQAATAFPGWELQNFSADKREEDIDDALGAMMSAYDNREYFRTVVSYSDSSWDEPGDDADYNVTETILETVYLDSAFKVNAYSLEYHNTGNGSHTTTEIFLMKNDTIIAGYSDDNEQGQIGAREQWKFVTSKCSACGTITSLHDGMDSWNAEGIPYSTVEQLNRSINLRITRIANDINDNWETKIDASPGYIVSASHTRDAGMPGRLGMIDKVKLYADQVGYVGFVGKRADQ